jgi:hypothetical protein
VLRVTARDDVLSALHTATVPLDDDELGRRTGRERHYVNALCRRLAADGLIRRYIGRDNKYVNQLITQGPFANAAPDDPVHQPVPSSASTVVAERPWCWEGNVQAVVVAHLQAEGWVVVSTADTASQQRGVDIVAERNGQRLLIEVKGWPGTTYARGPKAGQDKPTAPTLQARHWFAGAVLSAMALRDKEPGARVAIALPDYPRYRALVGAVRDSLNRLGVELIFVTEQGVVSFLDG